MEDEVLFFMHTTFCIYDIKSIEENDHLWGAALTLTNENDENLRALAEPFQENSY